MALSFQHASISSVSYIHWHSVNEVRLMLVTWYEYTRINYASFCWFCKIQPRTDRLAHDNSIYRASITSHRKNTADNIGTKCRRNCTGRPRQLTCPFTRHTAATAWQRQSFRPITLSICLLILPAYHAEQDLWNGRTSVCVSVCPSLSVPSVAPRRRYRSSKRGSVMYSCWGTRLNIDLLTNDITGKIWTDFRLILWTHSCEAENN